MLEGDRNRLQSQSAQPHEEQLIKKVTEIARIDVLLTKLYNHEPGSHHNIMSFPPDY